MWVTENQIRPAFIKAKLPFLTTLIDVTMIKEFPLSVQGLPGYQFPGYLSPLARP